ETALEAGDVVCFPVGPAGAHRVDNAGDETVRVPLFSTTHEFGSIESPDSDKIGIWGRHDEALDHMIRRSPDLDYWEGELPVSIGKCRLVITEWCRWLGSWVR